MSHDFQVSDIFHLRDGRTIFAGTVDHPGFIRLGRFEVWIDGRDCGTVLILGEEMPNFATPPREPRPRAISTSDPFHLDRDSLEGRRLVLRPVTGGVNREARMHRHLIGLNSPPRHYVAEPTTLAPILPEDWDGDAWYAPGKSGYFLRAWNKGEGRIAYGEGPHYEIARERLLEGVISASSRVEVVIHEDQPAGTSAGG
jgi:hypothetical protein